nr:reverse transcriptase domain-containing protein [Tanacetum cinerariifolium]
GLIDVIVKYLDLEPKIDAMMRDFLEWKELSKETNSKILSCRDGSCWKTFKLRRQKLDAVVVGLQHEVLQFPRRSKQPFILKESPIDTIADQRTMAELLRPPTEGYAEAIMVPPILAEQFELKHSRINMMTSDQFSD